jgi:hypothetical protein
MANEKKAKAEQIRANQAAAGIPDSKPFAASEAMETGASRILQCHINGQLVADMNLAPQVIIAIDYWSTDEGIAEKNARPNVREPSGITLGRDEFSKALEQRRDDVTDRDMDLYRARDPLKEVADRHSSPGMRPKFLSAAKLKESGGTGDYEVVKDSNGDPVQVRGLVLGQMPEARAKARSRHYQERGNKLLKEVGESYKREGGATAVADQ